MILKGDLNIGIKKKSRDQSRFAISLFKWRTVFQFVFFPAQNFIINLFMARARRFSLFSLNLPTAPNERFDFEALNAR